MSKKRLLFIAWVLVACLPSQAQKKKALIIDSLAMEVVYNDKKLAVHAQYFYYPGSNTTDSVYFSLNPSFDLSRVSAPGLKSHALKPRKDRPFPFQVLKFDKAFNRTVTEVQFDYTIDLGKLIPNEYDWIEMMVDQLWYPNATDLDNNFVSHLVVKGLPSDYTLCSYQSYKEIAGHSYTIDEHKPNVPEISFLAGKNMTVKKIRTDGITISYFTLNSTTDSTLNSIHEKMIKAITYFNSGFGKQKPVKEFTIALRSVPRKVMGYQTTRNGFVITGVDFNTSMGSFAHEFGHFWFMGADFIRESWLNESFANFVMMRALRKFEPDQAERSFNIFKKKAETPGPVSPAGSFDGGTSYDRYYSKGCYLLLQLEDQIGAEKMDKFLELRIRKNLNTTASVLDALESVTDKKTRDEFEGKIRGN